jgi:hypothetical protein
MLYNAGGEDTVFQPPKSIDGGAQSIDLLLTTAQNRPEPYLAPAGSLSIFRIEPHPM